MTEQSPLGSGFDSVYHISNDSKEDPFSDPPALNPQVSTGLAYTNEVKQSVWPSLSSKVALAEKSANHPILRNTTAAITNDAASPGDTSRNSGPPPRPHKIRHYAPSPEGQDLPCHLSPSKTWGPISRDNFRRFSTRAAEEVSMPCNTLPTEPGIDQHGMADDNTRADAWVRGKTICVIEKTAEKTMGSSPPGARYKSHSVGATPTPLKKTFGGGIRKTLSLRYSPEGVKKRRKGYELVPTTTDYETECESDGDSSAKDPFASGQDDGFERRIFAGESSDYIAEIPKRHRGFQEPYDWGTRAQNTQNLLAQTEEMDPSTKRAGTRSKFRKYKYDAGLEDKNLGEDWGEQKSSIAGAADTLMAYMSDSSENFSPSSVAQRSKRLSWGQLKTPSKTKSKKRAGKPLPLKKKRNPRSKLLGSTGDTSTGSTVGSGTEGFTVDVAQKQPESISTAHVAGGIKHHDARNDELVRDKTLGEGGLGSSDTLSGCNPPPGPFSVRVDTQSTTYPDALQAGGETEDFRQDNSVLDVGIDKGTRKNASLGTRRIQGNRQDEKGKPVTRPEASTFQGPTRTPRNDTANIVNIAGKKSIGSHEAKPLREKSLKSLLHNTKRRKDVKKIKTSKSKVKTVCEDDDVDELQMDLPGTRI
ncbi:hypothetical protein B9Z19DRAFT_796904 [Tuber borchii]|uniref:Uncharacterized protein n=1 Tax=Tuber borchii TaxID=42251 RepID=A0A2T6ZWA2_TUBBO|nr:hypothetical protein B9Z19DRAFT_796904 [Tuber borchii]